MDEGDDRGLSDGEMLVDDMGVDSAVSIRRRSGLLGRAVVVAAILIGGSTGAQVAGGGGR